MKLTDRAQVEQLSKFQGQGTPMTSFFLDTDKGRLTKKEISASINQLRHEGKARIESLGPGRERRETLAADLEAIDRYCAQNLPAYNQAGLALFSCSAKGFFQPLFLPHGPRNRILFDQNFYVRPLLAILEKYHRICAFLISRRDARWYGIHMGEIVALESLTSDVPARVKEAGFEGTAGKRIERHIEARLLEHFRKAAQITFDMFKKGKYDWLFLSCEDSLHTGLEPILHCDHCRDQRDDGLSGADVALEQPVHLRRPLHVLDDVLHRCLLPREGGRPRGRRAHAPRPRRPPPGLPRRLGLPGRAPRGPGARGRSGRRIAMTRRQRWIANSLASRCSANRSATASRLPNPISWT